MPRRIELELTSERPDGTWTWRAAGAREPKGELDASILPSGAKVGDVLRADADFDIEGITVLSVLPPKGAKPEPERIEIIGPQREFQPVTSTLTGRSERSDRRPRRDRDDRDRPRAPRDRDRDRDRPDRPRQDRPRGERPSGPRRERPAPPPPKPKPKKLRPGRAHRDELINGLSPEQQPIAEQLFRGGIPGVRAALDEQNAAARAEGKPEVPAGTVMQIAETLVGRVREADWLDRAEAAIADVDEIALRDLRAVVSSADDVARDDAARELAGKLKEALERRSTAEQAEWLRDIEHSLAAGRVVRALRLSSRPPQPGENLPEELSTRLSDAAGQAMTAEIAPDRWGTLLDAVAYSPVRRNVTPAGVPAEPGDELLGTVRKHAGRAPTIAQLFGIEPPPPGGKRGGGKRAAAAKRTASPAAPGGALRRPPKSPAGPIPSPILGRRIPPPPRPSAPPAPPAPGAPPTTGVASDEPTAPLPTETPAATVPAGPARAADEIPNVTPPAEPVQAPVDEAPPQEPAAPTQAGGLAAEGAAREANNEPVPQSVDEPVVGDDAADSVDRPTDAASGEQAPQVETVTEPAGADAPAPEQAAQVKTVTAPAGADAPPPEQAAQAETVTEPAGADAPPPEQAAQAETVTEPAGADAPAPEQAAPVETVSEPVENGERAKVPVDAAPEQAPEVETVTESIAADEQPRQPADLPPREDEG